MSKPLVIVESPAKAKTLARFLGNQFRVEASVGHVRDLPENASEVPESIKKESWGRMGVDVEHGFKPYYVVSSDRKSRIRELKAAVKDAPEVLLATDPDREGESISWHLREVLKPKGSVKRIVFHEITEEAVRDAIAHARDIDLKLVDAQESRRILDRLYGYMLSPVLWKKVQTGLSAGRVQSVAVRLIVEREEERRAFRRSAYWDLDARVRTADTQFTASLVRVGQERVASGKDFDPTTGALIGRNVRLLDEAAARGMRESLSQRLPWTVTSVEEKPATQRPSAPFTTSTLQQEANRKLGFSADRTMSAAQRLFQDGVISYHRTDSTTLSDKALREAARAIKGMYGEPFYGGPRQYQTKVKNAQEAHEAIRPTDFEQTPQSLSLPPDEARLYDLIWKRTVASQMAEAQLLRTTLEITATGADGTPHVFTATGKAIKFAGFLRAYVEGSDDPASELGDQETILPKLAVGDRITAPGLGPVALVGLDPKAHETVPPPRYTDASLVKRLEEDGIGRPSTYASIIQTIERRGYVWRQGKALVPSYTAFAVTRLLKDHFGQLVELGFTGRVEEDLDQVSNGELDRTAFLEQFYNGQDGWPGLRHLVTNEDRIDYPVIDLGVDPDSGQKIVIRIGRYGAYVQMGEANASIPEDVAPADFTLEQALTLLREKTQGPQSLGNDPKSGLPVYVLNGRFGPYVQLGEAPEKGSKEKPRRASLTKNDRPDTMTLARALELLSLPRTVGHDAETGQDIIANFGRFGPYVKRGDEFRSIGADSDVFTITLDQAIELFKQEKKRGRGRTATRTVLREVGLHPASQAKVEILEGRYGPYVTDGTTNASVPKDVAVDSLTLDEAVGLLKAREGTSAKKGRGRAPAKRAPAGGARKRAAKRSA
ncbi:DNA topoisomerase 1 [Luteitalea sp. TBR-22]|uniref:type I DNA topoisomerase n=1 Tax=Luteitalea sp. TBR-22 TaxID=2802971 RepID=UPI001AFA6610|nr:type I DNA topoisomerase [Luteitalea sp. TBR-22]BCS35218.1 DNA topoisomerase 1 [Luteitalea sp. TBR-22]